VVIAAGAEVAIAADRERRRVEGSELSAVDAGDTVKV
jgi:hypothetical protein